MGNSTAKILVVEDSIVSRKILVSYLEDEDFIVFAAENGTKGMEIFKDQPVDLILLDINMPVMDGYEVLARLRADQDYRHLPVVMISNLDELDSVVKCIENGAEDFLPKPVNKTMLKARIGASLDKKRFRDQERRYLERIRKEKQRSDALLDVVIPIGVAMSAEENFARLLELIHLVNHRLCR